MFISFMSTSFTLSLLGCLEPYPSTIYYMHASIPLTPIISLSPTYTYTCTVSVAHSGRCKEMDTKHQAWSQLPSQGISCKLNKHSNVRVISIIANVDIVSYNINPFKLFRTFCHKLQQISSTRDYPDRKIEEFKQRLDELKKEHQKFVAKVQQLDPSYKDTIPWQPRGYSRKRSHDSHVMSHYDPNNASEAEGQVACKRLCSPLLEKEQSKQSHDSHVTFSASEIAEEKHVIDEETPTRSTNNSSVNLLGLDYSSSEDES